MIKCVISDFRPKIMISRFHLSHQVYFSFCPNELRLCAHSKFVCSELDRVHISTSESSSKKVKCFKLVGQYNENSCSLIFPTNDAQKISTGCHWTGSSHSSLVCGLVKNNLNILQSTFSSFYGHDFEHKKKSLSVSSSCLNFCCLSFFFFFLLDA